MSGAVPVPGFRVARLLDSDGAAASYLGQVAAGPIAGRPAVLTVGHRPLATPAEQNAFREWATRLGTVSAHPGVADLLGHGLTPDHKPFLITGTAPNTLATVLRERGAREPDEVRALGISLADALAASHAAGLTHGAVRPATVLLTPAPQLAGFDAAAPGLAHPLAASPYTAPEHLAAAAAGQVAVSAAADVYGLALTLYAALGGRPPWAADDGSGITDPSLRGQPVPDVPGVTPALLAALRSALAPDPRQRPTAAAFRDSLTAVGAARAGQVRAGVTPVAVALLVGAGARPVAEAVVTAVTGTTGAAAGGTGVIAGAGGAASGATGASGYATTAADPGIGLNQATGSAATGSVGGGASGYATAADPGVGLSQATGSAATGSIGGGTASATTASTGAIAAGGAATGGAGIGGAVAGAGAATTAAGLGIGAKVAIAVAVIATVGGGGAAATYYASGDGDVGDKPAAITSPSPTIDRSIRNVDFRNITVRDPERQVTLSDGEAVVEDDVEAARYRLRHGPVYSDVDGDGDEDAALTFEMTQGNGWLQYGYIWLWQNGEAVQMDRPFSIDGRCGVTSLKSLTNGDKGIQVEVDLVDVRESCAGRRTGTDTYTLGVRDGYPVRIAPQFGPTETCDVPVDRTDVGRQVVSPRVAARDDAPAITPRREYTKVELLNGTRVEVDGFFWYLADLTAADGTRVCGWVSGYELGSD